MTIAISSLPAVSVVIAAANADVVVTVIIAVFSIIGWLVRTVSAASEERKLAEKRAQKSNKKELADEITLFLDDAAPGKNKNQQRPNQTRPAQTPKKKPQQQQQAKSKPQPKRADPVPTASASKKPNRPGENISKRGPQVAQDLGKDVQQHLKSYMADRIGQQVASDLNSSISSSVNEHLGQRTATTSVAATVYHAPTHPLVEAIRDPKTIRQSILVGLVLAPPPALAKNRQ